MSAIPERLTAALADRYRIERELGAGGMATVYLAADLKHDRKVALKVLKPELAAVLGAERFVVEIKTTAALQHPHILPLFDSGTAEGFLYYVMPYIQGETLRDKLNRETQFGVDEAVRIATEVADALDYAHRNGVIHRDIKPENILLHDGRPMVADFGIALALSAAAGGRMTETGLSLGTPHYMSPEQATAEKEITGRSDVYSLASVLYEMLAGQPPHLGGSAQQIIMKIIAEPVDAVTRYRKAVPPHVAGALAKALEKLPADRFATARAFAEALASVGFRHVTQTTAQGDVPGPYDARVARSSRLALGVMAVVTVLALAAALWGRTRTPPAPPPARLDLTIGSLPVVPGNDVVISPDGSMIAYAGQLGGTPPLIFVRRLAGEPDFRPLAGTEGATWPTFSPDNQWIAFRRSVADGAALAKVSVAGGGVSTIAPDARAGSLHWGTRDSLIYSTLEGQFIVSALGGVPRRLTQSTGRLGFLLPDGSGVLGMRGNDAVLHDFATDSLVTLVPSARYPTYAKSGHLLYLDDQGGLFAVPFDLARHRITGPPARVVDRVGFSVSSRGYSVSDEGTLVQFDAAASGAISAATSILVVQRLGGGRDTLRLPRARVLDPRVSPDGRRVAYVDASSRDGAGSEIFTFDVVTGTNTQLTFDSFNRYPIWSPDGKRLLYQRDSTGTGRHLFIKSADNSGAAQPVAESSDGLLPSGWPREDLVLFSRLASGQEDLYSAAATKDAKPQPYLVAPWPERAMSLSPDGKFAAFGATESNREDVWIRDFPTPVGKWKVTPSGGLWPRWSPKGDFVYFWRPGNPLDTLFRAQIERTPSVVVRAPELVAALDAAGISNWDLHPAGDRFVVAVPEIVAPVVGSATGGSAPSRYLVVKHWFTELRAKSAPSP